jgi:pimeloyl-ACP methyl ester carboxylesterase
MIIALHGDYANAEMLKRDIGSLEPMVDCFWDASGWRPAKREISKLKRYITSLPAEPPILIGYSRGGSIIAMLSNRYPIRAAVLYESPVLDSFTVGGTFPVLQIWNDQGVMTGKRKGQAAIAQEVWKKNHPVTELRGVGTHIKRKPIGHGWDVGLNDQIRKWIEACMNTNVPS